MLYTEPIKHNGSNLPALRGRPRAFNAVAALDAAMNVFWQKGYEGASLPVLTKAMRINRPSMYAAFGNKEALFKQALKRYTEQPGCHVSEALEQPTARKVAEHLLRGTAKLMSDPKNPRGCLLVQGALACGDDADCVRRASIAQRRAGEAALTKRFARAKKEGDLPKSADPATLARFLLSVAYGIAVHSTAGARRDDLMDIVATALRAWPR